MAEFSEEQIAGALDAKAANLTEGDLDRIYDNAKVVRKFIREFPSSWKKARKQANLLLSIVGTKSIPFESRAQAAGALIYLGSPIDLIPDEDSDGFEDDAAVVALAIERLESEVIAYCSEREMDLEDYL